MKTAIVFPLGLFVLLVSCATTPIPGTDIPDTPENRAVLEVFFKYVEALKAQDADRIVSLISEHYLDHNGTDDAGDDVDYQAVTRFVRSGAYHGIKAVNLVFIVKDMLLSDDGQTAKILYYYEVRLKTDRRVPPAEASSLNPSGEKWLKESDVNQMVLRKEASGWKIVSGL